VFSPAAILAAVYSLIYPYWDTQRRDRGKDGVMALTIVNAPNLILHPFGIVIMMLLGVFRLPTDPLFYAAWAVMVAVAAVAFGFVMLGLKATKFFAAQVIGKFGFAVSALMAMVLLAEAVSPTRLAAIFIGTVGVALFVWPRRH
jgi:hypothetical protein